MSSATSREKHNEWMRQYRQAHPCYGIWMNIKKRCGVIKGANESEQRNYLPKHLKMDETWRRSFAAFESWCMANGWEKGMWVGRLDVDGDYVPENCVACTPKEQVPRRDARKAVLRQWREGTTTGMVGRKHSEESKRLMSEKAKAIPHKKGWHHTDATKEKIAAGNRGRTVSAETRAKIAEANRRRIWAEESKEKRRQTLLRRRQERKTSSPEIGRD